VVGSMSLSREDARDEAVVRIPENEQSIPFTTYGNSTKFLPLLLAHGHEEWAVPFSVLFNVVSWRGVVRDSYSSCESVQTVSDGDVECFAKYPVPPRTICDHLSIST
jgi:hypothetical protein